MRQPVVMLNIAMVHYMNIQEIKPAEVVAVLRAMPEMVHSMDPVAVAWESLAGSFLVPEEGIRV